jgi:hypothetical protein
MRVDGVERSLERPPQIVDRQRTLRDRHRGSPYRPWSAAMKAPGARACRAVITVVRPIYATKPLFGLIVLRYGS